MESDFVKHYLIHYKEVKQLLVIHTIGSDPIIGEIMDIHNDCVAVICNEVPHVIRINAITYVRNAKK